MENNKGKVLKAIDNEISNDNRKYFVYTYFLSGNKKVYVQKTNLIKRDLYFWEEVVNKGNDSNHSYKIDFVKHYYAGKGFAYDSKEFSDYIKAYIKGINIKSRLNAKFSHTVHNGEARDLLFDYSQKISKDLADLTSSGTFDSFRDYIESWIPVFYLYLDKLYPNLKERLTDTLIAKNKDYGNSFDENVDTYGLPAISIRVSDKANRLDTLRKSNYQHKVNDETWLDTVFDFMGYLVLSQRYLRNIELNEKD